MKTLAGLSAALLLVVVSFGGGIWWSQRSETSAHQGRERQIAAYACPMHPQYRSDHAGDCPSCGMRLEPVYADGTAGGGGEAEPASPGAIHVSPERQQAIGVRLGVVERIAGARTLRTTGRVAPEENATYPIVAGASGWIREVRQATTGSQVRRNEVLATFYSPDLVTAEQSYYSGLDTLSRVDNQQLQAFNQARVVEGVQRFADTLRNLGVSEGQLQEMRRTRELIRDIHIVSPVDGFVLQRNVSAGLRFDRGFELYRIADLRRIWILADVYQHQLGFVRQGAGARVTSSQVGHPFSATVSRTEPVFDEATLTLKVRLEADNPGLALKPGMFVDVEFPLDLPPALAVPAEAIVDSGLRKTVFVDRGQGHFEPRHVETGWRVDDQVEIVKGLMAGERIVISGTFLIDSESRMKAAAMGIHGERFEDVVCGMDVDARRAIAAGRTSTHDGTTYYFCSEDCKKAFDAAPAKYVTK